MHQYTNGNQNEKSILNQTKNKVVKMENRKITRL